jgi:hypothetical protein
MPESYQFQFKQPKGFQDIEVFYEDFIKYLADDAYEQAVFNLLNVDFLIPEFLFALISTTKIWYEAKKTAVQWLAKGEVQQYLERANIFSVLDFALYEPDTIVSPWSRRSSLNLMELKEISAEPEANSQELPPILEACVSLLLGRFNPGQIRAVSTLLSEVGQNISHSHSRGYALVQIYQDSRVHIGVIDTGIGIPQSLAQKYPKLEKESDYLKKSLELGVSAKDARDGLGLFQVQQLVDKAGGALTIRSNSAMLQIQNKQIYQWDNLSHISGTQVFITAWGLYGKAEWNYLLPKS